MSPTAQVAVSAQERESGSWVLGIGLGLVLLAAGAAALLLVRPRALEPRAALADSFEPGELPFGLRLESAYALPTGETVVVIGDGRELDFDPATELDEAPRAEGADADEASKPDWSAVEVLSSEAPPARLFLVRYPRERAADALARAFRVEWRDLRDLGAEGGRLAVEAGELAWGAYAADFVRLRRFRPPAEPDGAPRFQDALRVNLALPERYWIATAVWPPGHAGSRAPVEALLAALLPVAPAGE